MKRGLFSIDKREASILSDRYLDVMFGDFGATLLLVLQAPLIAFLVAGVWSNASGDTTTLYFVLCLSAFFLGAVNSSREIVKERALLLRERMFGLSLGAYLLSKYRVQTMLVVLQCAILAGVVYGFVPVRINVVIVFLVLVLTALAGTAVGLTISAWVRSADKAVAAVPIAVIPQILFSDFVLGEDQLSNWTGYAEKVMPVRWGYDILNELYEVNWEVGDVILPVVVLSAMIGVLFMVALLLLRRAE